MNVHIAARVQTLLPRQIVRLEYRSMRRFLDVLSGCRVSRLADYFSNQLISYFIHRSPQSARSRTIREGRLKGVQKAELSGL